MSYCRFGWDGSEVYVYESSEGIECCGCHLYPDDHVVFETPEAMIGHLVEHRKAGFFVPEYAITGLWDDVEGAREPEGEEDKVFVDAKEMMNDARAHVEVGMFFLDNPDPVSEEAREWVLKFKKHELAMERKA